MKTETKTKKDILGTVKLSPFGVVIAVTDEGGALDYTMMKAAQLAALTAFVSISSGQSEEGLSSFSQTIQNNVLWLVSTMAQEVCDLLPIVSKEAENKGEWRAAQALVETKQNLHAAKSRNLKEATHATTS